MSSALSPLKWMLATLASVWTSLFLTVQLLVLMMVIDFVSGVMCAMKCGNLSAHTSWLVLMKKTAVLIVVMTTWLLQQAIVMAQGVHFAIDIAQTVAIAYIFSETLSIIENCACMGAPIPKIIRRTLAKLQTLLPGEE